MRLECESRRAQARTAFGTECTYFITRVLFIHCCCGIDSITPSHAYACFYWLVSQSLGLRGLVEAIGFYMIFVPSTFLLRVAATINDAVTVQVPANVPVIGGKCARV